MLGKVNVLWKNLLKLPRGNNVENKDYLSKMNQRPKIFSRKRKYFSDWLFNTSWGDILMKTFIFSMLSLTVAMVVFYVWAVSESARHPEKLGEMTLMAEGEGCQTYKVSRYLDTTYFTKCKDVSKITNKYDVQKGKQKFEVTTETLME